MKIFLIEFFRASIKSIFVSGVMFIIGLSIITGKFPPNFSKITEAYKGLISLKELSSKSSHQITSHSNDANRDNLSADVEALEKINEQRRNVASDFFSQKESGQESGKIDNKDQTAEINQIKEELRNLRYQVLKLQTELDALKNNKQPAH